MLEYFENFASNVDQEDKVLERRLRLKLKLNVTFFLTFCHLRYFRWDWPCTHYAWTHCSVHISCSSASVHLYRRTWRHPGLSMTSAYAGFSLVNPHRPITSLQIWTTHRPHTDFSQIIVGRYTQDPGPRAELKFLLTP